MADEATIHNVPWTIDQTDSKICLWAVCKQCDEIFASWSGAETMAEQMADYQYHLERGCQDAS